MRTSVANPIGPSFLSQAADAERLGRVELQERKPVTLSVQGVTCIDREASLPVEVKPVDSANDDK